MIRNIIIIVLLMCCAYLLLRLYAPEYVPEWLGAGGERAKRGGDDAATGQNPANPAQRAVAGTARSEEPSAGPKPARPLPKPVGAGEAKLVLGPPASAEGTPFGSRVLQKGMRGPDVAQLQERLKLAGFVHHYFAPGTFDEATEQALVAYQEGTAFLAEMYGFRGLPPPHKKTVDAELAKQLMKVPTPNKVIVRYAVAPKENLFRIATRFGVGPDSIRYLNNVQDRDVLKVGQSLMIICDRSKAN